MIYILYNPLSNNKKGEAALEKMKAVFEGKDFKAVNVLEIDDTAKFCSSLKNDDELVLCGGDGTLHKFVNKLYDLKLTQKMYYFPAGSGNDFAHDAEKAEKYLDCLIPLNDYMKSLPVVTVNGKKSYFINGIGMGIDGYCCLVGDEQRAQNVENINYAGIAIQGMLGKFHPGNAKVTVDGVTEEYKNVWLAPTMIGRYYGGGMMVAPNQDRFNAEKTVTNMCWAGKSKLLTLMRFSKIFTGGHTKYTKMIHFRTGHEIKVEFDRPIPLQIDGETVKDVTSYTVIYK